MSANIHEVYPYFRVKGAEEAIAFYTAVFGAKEKMRLNDPSGRIGHAELQLGPIVLMVSDEFPEYGMPAPSGHTGSSIHLHVDDADALIARAEAHGATITRPAEDQFYGERSGAFKDPFGHEWMIGHSIEEVSLEEMQRRYDAL